MELRKNGSAEQFAGGRVMAFTQPTRKLQRFFAIAFAGRASCGEKLVGDLRHRADYNERCAFASLGDDLRCAINRGGILDRGPAEFHHDHWGDPELTRSSRRLHHGG